MNETTIKRHSFEKAKNRLKEFTEKNEAELEIEKVRIDGGFFGLGDHKVTGDEFNTRLETIQNLIIHVNKTMKNMNEELREVYNIFDVIDEEVITSIIANLESIKKTSNDVRVQQGTLKQHNEKLAKQQNKLDAHQAEIEKNVANISKIVTALKVFKEKLEGYKHLTDIDKIWGYYKKTQNEMRVVSDTITKFSKKTTEDIVSANNKNKVLSDQINRDILNLRNEAKTFKEFCFDLSEKTEYIAELLDNQIPVIQETATFAEQLKNITHIEDIDFMWNDINETKEKFRMLREDLEKIEFFITVLNGYIHLRDIDNMWDDLDVVKINIKKINEDIKGNSESIQIHQNELGTLATTSTEHKKFIDTLFKKLDDAEEYVVNSRNSITELESFTTKVTTLNHLMEVDDVWKKTEEHKLCITKLEQVDKVHTEKLDELVQVDSRILQRIDSNEGEINDLKEYKEKLDGISHLEDVDSIWKSFEEHTSRLTESEKREEELAAVIHKNKDEVDKKIADAVQAANAAVESLTKRVKYAYWIAGGSAGFAIIELILLLVKVI